MTDERRQKTDTELAGDLHRQLSECAGFDGDAVSADRRRALNYYFQRPRGDEVRGRSNVVSGSISSMVEANLAQMLDSFTSDNIAEFDATGPEDDDQATLESFAVNKAVMKDNNGYQELAAAIKDALLLRNGWLKAYVDEDVETEVIDLENATPEVIAALREVPEVDEVAVLEFDDENHTARVRVQTTRREFVVESPDCANMLYPKQWHRTDLQRIPFIAERHVEPRAELLRRNFDKAKVDALPTWSGDYKLDTLARDIGEVGQVGHGTDKATDLVEWFECYVLLEGDDGLPERYRIGLGSGKSGEQSILEKEPVGIVPYCTGSPFINAHRLTGISLFDKLRQNEDITTGLERALLDNVNTVIKNRTFYLDGKVNTDDLADGRPNGNVRVRASVGDVRKAFATVSPPDLSRGILENLNHQANRRTEAGGAALELASGSMQMNGARIGSQGIDRAFSVMEQLAAHMTKNMATSLIRNLYLLAHATMRVYFDQPVAVKLNGRWESPTPSSWKPRKSVTVKIGMSPNERARRVSSLGDVIQAQLSLADKGMDNVLVNIEGFYRALTDWGRAAELPNPEQYFLDPSTDDSKRALKLKEDAAQRDAQAQRALMQQAVGLEQMGRALEKYRADQETEFKYWRETLLAEIEEAKLVGKATLDLISQTRFNGGNNDGKPAGESGDGGSDTADQE